MYLLNLFLLVSITSTSTEVQSFKAIECLTPSGALKKLLFFKTVKLNSLNYVNTIYVLNNDYSLNHRRYIKYSPERHNIIKEEVLSPNGSSLISTNYTLNDKNLRESAYSLQVIKGKKVKIFHIYSSGLYNGNYYYINKEIYINKPIPSNIVYKIHAVFDKYERPESITIYKKSYPTKQAPLELYKKVKIYYYERRPVSLPNTIKYQYLELLTFSILHKVSHTKARCYPFFVMPSSPLTPKVKYLIHLDKYNRVTEVDIFKYDEIGRPLIIKRYTGIVHFSDLKAKFKTTFKLKTIEKYYWVLDERLKKIVEGILTPAQIPIASAKKPSSKYIAIVEDIPVTKPVGKLTPKFIEEPIEVDLKPSKLTDLTKGWRFTVETPISSYAISPNYAVIITRSGKVYSLSLSYPPKIVWQEEMGATSKPIIDTPRSIAIITTTKGAVIAKNLKDGKTVWKQENIGASSIPMAYHGTYLYIPTTANEVVVVNVADGKISKTISGLAVASNLIPIPGKIITYTLNKGLVAIDMATWKALALPFGPLPGKLEKIITSPAYTPKLGKLAFATSTGYLKIADTNTEKIVWQKKIGNIKSLATDSQDYIYVLLNNGQLLSVYLPTYKINKYFVGINPKINFNSGKLVVISDKYKITLYSPDMKTKETFYDELGESVSSDVYIQNNRIFYIAGQSLVSASLK